jgi:hypothetical protein
MVLTEPKLAGARKNIAKIFEEFCSGMLFLAAFSPIFVLVTIFDIKLVQWLL